MDSSSCSSSSCNQPTCNGEANSRLDHLFISASPLCTKCASAEPSSNTNGLCSSCFKTYLHTKFKQTVTSNFMILPTDSVLVAYSGGPSSRVVLEFIHEMQSKSFESWEASNSQSLPVFSVGVVFINEISSISNKEIEIGIKEMKSMVMNLSPPKKDFYIITIEDELREILNEIKDETGKEDFSGYLRINTLQKVALENGYNKIVLGSSASSIARYIISSTVKGKGYSLPGEIQYVDNRYKVPLILPMRDCLQQELITLCNIERLKTQSIFEKSLIGINGLVSSFISQLREENPSREHTILRTASKLKPFKFNKFDINHLKFIPSRIRPKFQEHENVFDDEFFCLLCNSPFSKKEDKNERFCESCEFGIIPKGEIEREKFMKLLPNSFKQRSLLREEIKEYLIDGENDE